MQVKHAKTDNIAAWTQAQLDAIIAGGAAPLPPTGTLLNDVVVSDDWNAAHTVTGTANTLAGYDSGGASQDVTPANGMSVSGSSLVLGAITPTSVNASGVVAGSNLSGTNTGDQTYTADESTLHLSGTTFSIKSTYTGQSSITTLGTIGTGIWNAGAVTSSGDVVAGGGIAAATNFLIGANAASVSSSYSIPSVVQGAHLKADNVNENILALTTRDTGPNNPLGFVGKIDSSVGVINFDATYLGVSGAYLCFAATGVTIGGSESVVPPGGAMLYVVGNVDITGSLASGNAAVQDFSAAGGLFTIDSSGNITQVAGTPCVADGTYTVGLGITQNGTITTSGGVITAIQEAM